jgi:hypothetical protein
MINLLIFIVTLKERPLFLHYSEPFILFNNDVLYLSLRVRCQLIVEVKMSIALLHVVNGLSNLQVVLLLPSLENSSVELRKLRGSLLL